ncbi:type I DNA topoisomerase [Anaerolineales bacterium HSG24]|nr:type I DNA topoisomerase [Anaerolineales bacterium HSG24]
MKCKEKRDMLRVQAVYTSAGTPGINGACAVCGTKMFKISRIPEHANLPVPEKVERKPRKTEAKKSKTSTKGKGKGKKSKKAAPRRRGKLVIVESPAKAKTVGKFLGKGYTVRASVGHVRDLLRSQLSVDVENDFNPKYRIPNEKRDVVKDVKHAAERATRIYLATDPDREGEAIAWHLLEAAEIDPKRTQRVVFHEITKDAVADAFAHPKEIDQDRVNAQQARRILDRLVGYQISPLLWRKVRGRTSAGRVQSVSLRLVVEREHEIEEFISVEYWSIEADLNTAPKNTNGHIRGEQFRANLTRIRGEKAELKNQEDTQTIVNELQQSDYMIQKVKKSERRRKPAAPFTTSTLQQEASRRLGFGTRKTMRIAQQLYEGIDLGQDGTVGLITYMRTDSTTVSKQAQQEARDYIAQRYGSEMVPETPPIYKTKNKSAQEAHEAIRPTGVIRSPESVKKSLSRDQNRLYTLIWQRFVASQMANAVYDTMSVTIKAGLAGSGDPKNWPYQLQANGSRLKFKGFLMVYEEAQDEDAKSDKKGDKLLPDLTAEQIVHLVKLIPEQHFTQPPPRYTEATLVKTLEEHGIGRPSTYAPTVSTIQQRGYVEKFEKRLYPTELGGIICDLLVEYFPDIINVAFTAKMENDLDRIARGETNWVPVLNEFYKPFEQALAYAEENMPEVEIADPQTGEMCEKCGSPMVLKMGRYGKFQACSNFPECRNAKPYFVKIGVACPNDDGELIERRTKKGRIFYGCINYPDCTWSSWKKPLPTPCYECDGLLVQQSRYNAKCIECDTEYSLKELAEQKEPADTELVMA